MVLERQAAKPSSAPSDKQIRRALGYLKTHGKTTFASITAADGPYLQVAGGGVSCCLERRDALGVQWRAFVDDPHVPFEDGTELRFGGGVLVLRRDEWLKIDLVADAFVAFGSGQRLPAAPRWRRVKVRD